MKVGNRFIGGMEPFVIAEIGSNHLGNFKLCLQMVKMAKKCGVDAVKLQKRDNKRMFTEEMYNAPYATEFSYGTTYGEHREKLDWFGADEYAEIKKLCAELDLVFFSTAFDESSADFLHALKMPLFKIASCDARNLPLIRHVAKFGKPLMISFGGCTIEEIEKIVAHVLPINENLILAHCVSTYPNFDEQLQLKAIEAMKAKFPKAVIGFSSHHPGMLPMFIAYMCGARVFEVHFTMNRAMGGTDHSFSFEPHALTKLCEDLRRISIMLGPGERVVLPEEKQRGGFLHKMGKSIYLAGSFKKGHVLRDHDICLKAPADGIHAFYYDEVIGKKLRRDVKEGQPLTWEEI